MTLTAAQLDEPKEAVMTDTEIPLEPCPFCGAPALIERDSDHHGEWFNLGCSKHYASKGADPDTACRGGRLWYTEPLSELPAAIAAWNRRSSRPAAVEGWRDIASAPKDGTKFVAYSETNGLYDILRWVHADRGYQDHFESTRGYGGIPVAFLSLWQPLPAAPQASTTTEAKGTGPA